MSLLQRRFPGLLLASSNRRKSREKNKKRKRREKDPIEVDESIALPDPQTLLLDQARLLPIGRWREGR